MQAQDGLNEELLDDGQAARILGDLNAHVVFNRAAINHINSFTRDDLLDKKNRSMMNFERSFPDSVGGIYRAFDQKY